ncbi:MAG: DUF4345 family protein [Pseudomonadota bacterium]|jgi:hypothetical protein|uniref:DUF4345 family protein n=1 Tax=Alcanivorax sp. TaxID=1872427 RepID=UPI0025BB4B9C|nr:DUF4345 family protein [Alcanivorax sp.]MEE3320543.1 DUF4345 family protein [Pseudomonadota bacterium]
MPMLLVRLVAAVFLLYGLGFIVAPGVLMSQVVGEVPVASSAWIDLRATYGGLSVGVGVILWVLAGSAATLRTGALGVSVLMVAMALGRSVGIAVDGNPNGYMLLYLVMEAIAAILGIWAWWRLRATGS